MIGSIISYADDTILISEASSWNLAETKMNNYYNYLRKYIIA